MFKAPESSWALSATICRSGPARRNPWLPGQRPPRQGPAVPPGERESDGRGQGPLGAPLLGSGRPGVWEPLGVDPTCANAQLCLGMSRRLGRRP